MILDLLIQLRPLITDIQLTRIGPNEDGGYVVPDCFDGITTCFSPGVGPYANFEFDLQQKYKIGSHLVDGSVDGPPEGFFPLSFVKKFVSDHDDENNITMDTWVNSLANPDDNNLLLQMDIEGGEYPAFDGMSQETLKRFKIVVLEIHDVIRWMNADAEKAEKFLSKLTMDHYVTWLSPNNNADFADLKFELAALGPGKFGHLTLPDVIELSLIRKDCVKEVTGIQTQWPHPLDFPQNRHMPGVVLTEGWPGKFLVKT
jgi:hypothetical protein